MIVCLLAIANDCLTGPEEFIPWDFLSKKCNKTRAWVARVIARNAVTKQSPERNSEIFTPFTPSRHHHRPTTYPFARKRDHGHTKLGHGWHEALHFYYKKTKKLSRKTKNRGELCFIFCFDDDSNPALGGKVTPLADLIDEE
jgi:hypothetical protein